MALLDLEQVFFSSRSSDLATNWREFLGYFVKQFWPGVNTQIDKLPLTRLDFPLLVLPFFLMAFLALLAFWERPRPRNAILAGVTAGLLSYVYFHTWIYWLAVMTFLALAVLLFYRRDAERLRGMALAILSASVILIPYAFNYYRFITAPGHEDFILRLSLAEGREVFWAGLGFDYLAYLAAGVLVWLLYCAKRRIPRRSAARMKAQVEIERAEMVEAREHTRNKAFISIPHRSAVRMLYFKRDRNRTVFLLVLLAAMPAVWNVQLLTGFVPAPDHWPKAISVVLFMVSAVILFELARRVLQRWPRLAPIISALLIIGSLAVVSKKVVNVVSLSRGLQSWVVGKYAFPKDIADSWEWINANLSGEPQMVSSSFLTSQYLAVYTSARPYLPQSIISSLPTAEFERRYLISSRLFDVPEAVIGAELASKAPPMECHDPGCYYRDENFSKLSDDLYACYFSRGSVNAYFRQGCGRVPEVKRAELLARYSALRPRWQDIQADYVYYGLWERQFSQPDFERDPQLVLVYQNPLVKIFKIQKP